jgi:hypothetical protein
LPRNIATSVENNFVNGFVTEATALNFPENACIESQNCTFLLKSNVKRREGFDFESGYVETEINRDNKALSDYYWKGAGGSGNYNFLVRQIGLTLHFFLQSEDALSANKHTDTIDLTSHIASGAPSGEQIECQFSYGKGFLFVTHPYMNPIVVEYDPDTDALSAEEVEIKIRDFEGIDDGNNWEYQYRPPQGFETNDLKYNLYNQGWEPQDAGGLTDIKTYIPTGATALGPPVNAVIGDPYQTWKNNRTDLPSNADVWWVYKDSYDIFQPKLANLQMMGNTPAPKGHYILNAFYQDRSAVSGLPGLTVVTANYHRPNTTAFFAGRVWYAGVDTKDFSNKIYFSQIVRTKKEFGNCYQSNDPTSEHLFDLLATDGGVIDILDCGTIIKLVSIQSNLIIFATNGVWAINGSSGIGFTATDFSVRKISSIPCISHSSFVDISGTPCWWNTDGIYIVSGADAVGQIQITSLTEKKIKAFFIDDIPTGNKSYVKGSFNSLSKVVQWVYRSEEISSFNERYEFDHILCFNTLTQAFYAWTFPSSDVKLTGIVAVQGKASSLTVGSVIDESSSLVTDTLGAIVTTDIVTTTETASVFKYIICRNDGVINRHSFAEEYDQRKLDFFSLDSVGIDYESYFISGYKVHGEGQKRFQTNYLVLYCDNTDRGEFHFQSIWDYSNTPSNGEFGTAQYVTWTDQTRDYIVKRLKIRGMGLALQFKVQSISGKSFNIVGWSGFESGNARI